MTQAVLQHGGGGGGGVVDEIQPKNQNSPDVNTSCPRRIRCKSTWALTAAVALFSTFDTLVT